ncbi:MAG: hypothetical protein KC731_26620 [Myxococcales bacterium]|nr:hypothetical protein [Myxococcales bacterium]
MGATGVVAVGGAGAWHHRRQRTCPQCAIRMEMIPDEEDDVKLDAGQRTEEAIGSVDYQLFFCRQCGFNRVIENGKWFSGYSRCGGCGYKTSRTTSTTISAATTTSTGLEEVSTSCEHCGASSTHTRVIPMISPPSDNSSSSSSSFGGGSDSFGGGSSGGGGAGSSW